MAQQVARAVIALQQQGIVQASKAETVVVGGCLQRTVSARTFPLLFRRSGLGRKTP